MKTVNLNEAAALLNKRPATIKAWFAKGCPVIKKGNQKKEWVISIADVMDWKEKEAKKEHEAKQDEPLSWEARKQKADAELAEIKTAKAKGEVALLDEIERQYNEAAHEIKARLRQIQSRAAPQLLGVKTEKEIKVILLDEIDEALLSIAKDEL